jgi:hypothetical protein
MPPPDPSADQARAAIETALGQIGFTLPGTITIRHARCGKPRCACAADPPSLHGPYIQWTRTVNGKTDTQRQPDKSTRPWPVTRPGAVAPPPLRSRQRRPARQWRGPARSASVPASPLPRWPALPADTSPAACPERSGTARISRSSGSAKTAHPGRSASTGTARAASPTSNAAPLNARTAATALSSPAPSSISSANTIRTSPRRSAPCSPATDSNSNPNRYVPPTAIASRTDSGSCTNPRHRPACSAPEAGSGFREDELAGGGLVWPCSTRSLLSWMRAT